MMCHGRSHPRQLLTKQMTSFLHRLRQYLSSLHKVQQRSPHLSGCCHHGIHNACSWLSWLIICRTCTSSQTSCLFLLHPTMCQHQGTLCHTLILGLHRLALSVHLLTFQRICLLSIRATAVSHTLHHVKRLYTVDQSHGFRTSIGMTPASLPA